MNWRFVRLNKRRPHRNSRSIPSNTEAGFVLPTVTLLLLIASLVVAALVFRSFSRTTQVIANRQQQIIVNAATPAIERGKAKLEYLFTQDQLPPLATDYDILTKLSSPTYRLPDETGLDINQDGNPNNDSAWFYRLDTNGGSQDMVTYAILSRGSNSTGTVGIGDRDTLKAKDLIVRNGPIQLSGGGYNPNCTKVNLSPTPGWLPINSAIFRKAFQVDAFIRNSNGIATTLELQQDRQSERGNKWGAWFRYDLEISPTNLFNWSGAIYTGGNLILNRSGNTSLSLYPVSSPHSCIYEPSNSEIVINQGTNPTNPSQYSFQGQVLVGNVQENRFGRDVTIVLANPPTGERRTLVASGSQTNSIQDSVNDTNGSATVSNYLMDPVILLTEDQEQSRDSQNLTNTQNRNLEWNPRQVTTNQLVQSNRIYNDQRTKPSIDDTYRADNRWGPKASYGANPVIPVGSNGQLISSTDPNYDWLTRKNPPSPQDEETFGLDGYWERRASAQGVRLIVGQRLELGNLYGWNNGTDRNADPLYPPQENAAKDSSMESEGRTHEQRQMATLRDNLAAVQSTAVYHYQSGEFPVACVATTAHPGTETSIQNSITFGFDPKKPSVPITNFFNGTGTNGWEFFPPGSIQEQPALEPDFERLINDGASPLRVALQNLAQLTGDPTGAFPPEPGTSPRSSRTMWGDFSELRRILGTRIQSRYANLSLAEKSYLHTAACTMGMLAHNVDYFANYQPENGKPDGTTEGSVNQLADAFMALMDGNRWDGVEVANGDGMANSNDQVNWFPSKYETKYYQDLPPENYLRQLEEVNSPEPVSYYFGRESFNNRFGAPGTGKRQKLVTLARTLRLKLQLERDRRFGFKPTKSNQPRPQVKVVRNNTSDPLEYSNDCYEQKLPLLEKIDEFPVPMGIGLPPGITAKDLKNQRQYALTMALCEPKPYYPSLFYLFPKAIHDGEGNYFDKEKVAAAGLPKQEDVTPQGAGLDGQYQVVGSTDGIEDDINTENPGKVALRPRSLDRWVLPTTTSTTANSICIFNNSTCETRSLSLLDKGIYNGRERMAVRVLDIDLNLLRSNRSMGGDYWLPLPSLQAGVSPTTGAILYGFREDAVREDGIARPASSPDYSTWKTNWRNWSNATSQSNLTGMVEYTMNGVGGGYNDPPRHPNNGISPKSVDYYPDPDRRPHGFRLRNGEDLRRSASLNDLRGMTFVSDNPVYIQGDFNLHDREEFVNRLTQPGWDNFFTRNNLDSAFATANDRWRPAEIIGDGVTILSSRFVDGNIASGIATTNQSTPGTNSFETFLHPVKFRDSNEIPLISWVREDGSTDGSKVDQKTRAQIKAPIKITRDGFPVHCVTSGGKPPENPLGSCIGTGNFEVEYGRETKEPLQSPPQSPPPPKLENGFFRLANIFRFATNDSDNLRPAGWATSTTVNAVVATGIVPSRTYQSYGGLPNVIRFLEDWSTSTINMHGAFYQLNFSNYATAPFDHSVSAWEPGQLPIAAPTTGYFRNPLRNWGFDTALLYVPATPLARRLTMVSNLRSEFYRELPLEDPYIRLLRCGRTGGVGNGRVDPTVSGCS